MTSWLSRRICLASRYTSPDLGSIFWRATFSASLLAWCTPRLDVRFAVLYAARLPPAFHSLKHLHFSLTPSSTWLFHHQVCFFHGWFEETPHTCFVACKSLSFSEVQCSSTVLVCDSSLSSVLALNTSESSACFPGSLSFHTLMHGTNLRLGWGGMETLKSPTSSLCCDAHSSPSMTFTLDTCFLKLRWYRMKSIWVAAFPDW